LLLLLLLLLLLVVLVVVVVVVMVVVVALTEKTSDLVKAEYVTGLVAVTYTGGLVHSILANKTCLDCGCVDDKVVWFVVGHVCWLMLS
jgi:hypothetical protein